MHVSVSSLFFFLIFTWFMTEIVWYNKHLHRINSLSHHFILHQQTRYGMLLNGIFATIILIFIVHHHHTVCDLIMVSLLTYLFYDFTCGYNRHETINRQMQKRFHYPIAGLFIMFLYLWSLYYKIIPDKFMTLIILVNMCCILYIMLFTHDIDDNHCVEWFGILEFSIFFLFIVHCYIRKKT